MKRLTIVLGIMAAISLLYAVWTIYTELNRYRQPFYTPIPVRQIDEIGEIIKE